MNDIWAKSLMIASRMDHPAPGQMRVRDVKRWNAPRWWRKDETLGEHRVIDLNRL